MTHIIRLNVAGIGYDVCVWRGGTLSRAPLGQTPPMASPAESECVEKVQCRLDDALNGRSLPWSMAFACAAGDAPLAIGYAGRLEAPDDKGRTGVRFTHIVLCENGGAAIRNTMAVLALLSAHRFEKFSRSLAAIAIGEEAPDPFISSIVEEIAGSAASLSVPSGLGSSTRFREIVHDTAGAAPVAWITLLVQQISVPAPWEIYDTVRSPEGGYATSCSPPEGLVAKASALMLPTIGQAHDEGTVKDPLPTGTAIHAGNVPSLTEGMSRLGDRVAGAADRSPSLDSSTGFTVRGPVPTHYLSALPSLVALVICVLSPGALLVGFAWELVDPYRIVLAISGMISLILSFFLLPRALRVGASEGGWGASRPRMYLSGQVIFGSVGLVLLAWFASALPAGVVGASSAGLSSRPGDDGIDARARLADTVAALGKVRDSVRIITDSLQHSDSIAAAARDTFNAVKGERDSALVRVARLQRQLNGLRQPRRTGSDSVLRAASTDTSARRPVRP